MPWFRYTHSRSFYDDTRVLSSSSLPAAHYWLIELPNIRHGETQSRDQAHEEMQALTRLPSRQQPGQEPHLTRDHREESQYQSHNVTNEAHLTLDDLGQNLAVAPSAGQHPLRAQSKTRGVSRITIQEHHSPYRRIVRSRLNRAGSHAV